MARQWRNGYEAHLQGKSKTASLRRWELALNCRPYFAVSTLNTETREVAFPRIEYSSQRKILRTLPMGFKFKATKLFKQSINLFAKDPGQNFLKSFYSNLTTLMI